MIASYENTAKSADKSFALKYRRDDGFKFYWHYNSCFELTVITKGSGRRYVGDSITDFSSGDTVLIAPNVPHTWASYDLDKSAEAIVVHFEKDFAGSGFFDIPEMRNIKELLRSSLAGLHFQGDTHKICQSLEELINLENWQKITKLIEILGLLSQWAHTSSLSTKKSFESLDFHTQTRFGKVCRYLDANFTKPLSQAKIASQIFMSPSRFSQFFKQTSGKSYIQYLNELRIAHACKLLVDTDAPITDICFKCGYSNIANFNRRFQKIKQTTPREYRRAFGLR